MKTFLNTLKGALVITLLLSSCAVSQRVWAADEQSAHVLTPERMTALPSAERAVWQAYYDRSQAHLREEKALLAAEVKMAGLNKPLPAPGNSGFGGFSIARKKPADWFGSDEARQMADAAITFQTPTGGWAKGVEFNQGLRKPGMHWTLKTDEWYYVGTFDNNVFMGNMTTLAKIYQATKEPRYATAFLKGLDYIFDAQFPNGGWPQTYPLNGWYHDEVTYNDQAMTNIVGLLRDVATGQPDYSFVDEVRRGKARVGMEKGLRCILKTQIVQNGKLTAWCAQYDPITLEAAPARKFEVASLSGWESADIVRFLMGIEPPTPEVKNSIESAVAWFEKSKITGFEVASSLNAVGGRVFTLKPNPTAGPLWARFYELRTNRPIFVTREAKVYYSLSDLDQSGPGNGYNWYVNQPQKLMEQDYPKWRARWSASTSIAPLQVPALQQLKPKQLKPNTIVAADGSGNYKTVQEAVNAAPDNNAAPFVIHIKAGKYESNVIVPKNKPNITFQGEGAGKTFLSWNRSVYDPKPEGAHTFNPGLFVAANDFRVTNLTIENTAGDRGQALAAVVDGDRVTFENCRLLGWQDTLMVNNGRQYFKDCYIEGRVDFIYGSGTAVFDHCELHSKNGGYVTAASTPQEKPFGFVFLNCKLTGDPNPWIDPATGQAKSKPGALALLGRPWRAYASVAFINCQMGEHIRPEGWSNWGKVENEKTARYAEYNTQTLDGKPLDVSKRLPWTKQLTAQEAAQYTITNVLGGTGPGQPFGDAAAKPIKIVRTAPPGVLFAQNATINGTNAQLENDGDNIGYWTNTDTRFTWPLNLPLGTYRVALVYALDPASAGSDLQISVGDQNFELKPPATGGWSDYKTLEVGQAEIGKSNTSLTVNATSKKGNFILNLRQVTLTAANATGGQTPTGAVAEVVKPAQYKVRIVLGGDSTVTDNAGWGLGFKKQLKSEIELINLSKGGRSSGSFIQEGRWKQTLELKPDYVLVQFGHNDQPGHGPERETDPQTTYKANMTRYVDEARAAGIKPILVTPVSRRQWGPHGKINSSLTPYAEAVKQIAAEKKVPLIDLHALSIALYEKMGDKGVQEISPTKTGGGFDGTHFNEKGGEIVGKIVADALNQAVPTLAPYINPA